jgi:imidazolonepropionase-like amidohydrolase
MNRRIAGLVTGLIASLGLVGAASAQNLVLSNARILVGDGRVIAKGAVVVKDGKIVSVAAGAAPAGAAGTRIDATGMTVMPGFIDDHRHLIYGPADKWFADTAATEMRELLEAGYTTVQTGGDETASIVKLKKMVESGQLKGPRIVAAGWTPVGELKTEAEVRAAIRATIAAGVDSIAEIIYPAKANPFSPTELETKNLAIAIDEANKAHIPVQVHAVSPAAMVDAVRLGTKKLIHTPHYGWVTDAQAKAVKDAGAQVSSCTGFGAPVFGVFNKDNKPTFRDGKPWPEGIAGGEGRGREAGYKPVNARTLFDNGVTLGFCTDTNYNATAAVAQELKVLNLTFSPIDIVKIMGPNSAALLDRTDIGMLEPGKLGDLVVLTGNPLDGYWNFLTAVVVVKQGVIMVDKRAQLQSVRTLRR